jgi:hypothetical protein
MSNPLSRETLIGAADQPTDDDYQIAPDPEQGLSAWDEAIQRKVQEDIERGSPYAPVEMVDEPVRYSVRDLLFLTGIAAVVFGVSRTLPQGAVAGFLGLLALLGLIGLSIVKPQNSIFHVGWWVLLLMYLVTAVAAVIGVR